MQLPFNMRDMLVDDLDRYLEAFSGDPDPEAVANYVIELVETMADEEGIDDIVSTLEDEGGLDGTLLETLEAEIGSNDEFECTGEELVSLLERLCEIEWEEDEGGDDEDDDDDDDLDDDF